MSGNSIIFLGERKKKRSFQGTYGYWLVPISLQVAVLPWAKIDNQDTWGFPFEHPVFILSLSNDIPVGMVFFFFLSAEESIRRDIEYVSLARKLMEEEEAFLC